MRILALAAGLAAGLVGLGAQGALDRIVVHVNGAPILLSDIRQARLLKLVPGESDAAIQRALENRLLMLAEASRGRTPGPGPDVGVRRRQWETLLGGPVTERLARAGMSAAALDDWLRNDLRIEAYIEERFGALPAADREQAVQRWIAGLRTRADIR
jgi:hypothetical protein